MIEKKIIETLLASQNYREAIKRVYEVFKESNPHFSWTIFSQKADFSSRGFPVDVVSGNKRITSRSLPKFIKGLGLQGEPAHFFSLLVCLEESDINYKNLEGQKLLDAYQKSRSKLNEEIKDKLINPSEELFKFREWPFIYASLGTAEKGVSFEEILEKTSFSAEKCKKILQLMMDQEIVKLHPKTNKYLPQSLHLIFKNLGSHSFYQDYFLECLGVTQRKATFAFKKPENLFYNAVLSVDESRLPQLKNELRETLEKFVDDVESPNGKKLITIALGLTSFN